MVPDFPGLCGLDVGDGSLWEVNVEAQEVKVVHCFQFDWITEKVAVDEGLDFWMAGWERKCSLRTMKRLSTYL